MNNPMYELRNMTINEWLNTQSKEVQNLFDKQMHEIVFLRTKLHDAIRQINASRLREMNNILELLPVTELTDTELVELADTDLEAQDKSDIRQELCRREICYNG